MWWGALPTLRGGGGRAPGKRWKGKIWTAGSQNLGGGGWDDGRGKGGGKGGKGGASNGPKDLYVGGFAKTAEGDAGAAASVQQQLEQLFRKHGAAQILAHPHRGFAFVKFNAHAEARAAMGALNSASFMGGALKISLAQGGGGGGGGGGMGGGGKGGYR